MNGAEVKGEKAEDVGDAECLDRRSDPEENEKGDPP
jgi:hypothetical protein